MLPAPSDELFLVVPGTEVVHGLTSFLRAHAMWAVISGRGWPERELKGSHSTQGLALRSRGLDRPTWVMHAVRRSLVHARRRRRHRSYVGRKTVNLNPFP